ncbi:DNA topoisomerase 2 [Lecanosticta acicola]|uniref:DNA topoisomerase 2 n=1 Tax=Lecanosticta acicola TaxID=111012 RepID=A0AAI8W1Y9_9PEZI|nr:DNA topoisomerase 2 [Lecanosticta acicola]
MSSDPHTHATPTSDDSASEHEGHDTIAYQVERCMRHLIYTLNRRVLDAHGPFWSGRIHPKFRAVAIHPYESKFEEWIAHLNGLAVRHPTYYVRVANMTTDVFASDGYARTFTEFEATGIPEGVSKRSVTINEFHLYNGKWQWYSGQAMDSHAMGQTTEVKDANHMAKAALPHVTVLKPISPDQNDVGSRSRPPKRDMDDSIDDGSAFEMDASSDFEPQAKPAPKAPAKKAAAPKPKATKQTTLKTTKAAPKAKAAPKPKKRAKPDSDEENTDLDGESNNDDSLLSNTPPSAKKQKKAPAPKKAAGKPLAELENESFNMDVPVEKPTSKKGTSTEQYQKLTQLEHILKRPDTYIGSVESTTEQMWVYNSQTESMEYRKVSFVPGLYKIFDEILVNAADNKQRDKNMNEMRVWVNAEKGVIAVKNNGRGIPIEMHEKEGIYIPEMIFGHLLTSSNYDDDEAKVTGGRNGYGAKLTNIYSTQFQLETVDSKTKQKYSQTWRKNMSIMEKAKIEKAKGSDDYTLITFMPDFNKFGMDKMDEDFEALVKRRVYDMAGTAKGVKVYLNGERIKISKFKQYMEMYTKAIKSENLANDGTAPEQVILTDNPHERWEIGFAVSDGSFQQVSFVNSIATSSGGTHVNYIADQICDKLEEIVNKKNKGGVKLKKAQIRNHIFLFVNCLIVNPAFTSQTKEQLTTKVSAFGSKPQVTEKFLKDIAKTEAVNNIIHFAQQKADKVLAKSDGGRRQRMNNSKLTDANKAGTAHGHQCTLILTEGDSASLLALAGRAVVNPDLFGVFPLRGKILNVRDASIDQISKNQEIQNIKKFIGLQHKKEYTTTKGLRYGHIMIMTDQDHDGSHIKGLLINFLQVQFPSLLKLEGFLMEFITPIVKVWKGDPKNPKAKKDFFTMPEYEAWRQDPGNQRGWEHKYYKGLGTSDTRDAQIYFADLDRHLKEFHEMQEHEPELIDLAFSKKKADARKTWLGNFTPGTYLDMSGTGRITYDDFINKELILFSMADNMRSIPSVVDGLKPGQRKVLYTCFRRNLKKDVKVVELAGSVSGLTAYAYGDTSLQQTIVGLAQNFVGSNNMNVLEPSGNFGSRLQGGQDAASARYIYTRLSPFARRVFNQADEPLLKYNIDDGKEIEPETYCPIVPMILINGADGIGTGWSTSIPNYSPIDVIDNLIRRMDEGKDSMVFMKPWFRGWSGETEQLSDERFKFAGKIQKTGDEEVEITELPVRYWTQDFKDKLEEVLKAEKVPSFIKDYTEYNTPETIHFIVKMEAKKLQENENKLEDLFKLAKTQATTNLVAFDPQGRIRKYHTPLEIMEEFYQHRLNMYIDRKKYMLNEMQRELDKLTNQARFVQMIIDGKLVVSKKKKTVLVAELQKLGFKRFPKIVDAKKEGEFEPVVEQDNDESDAAEAEAGASDFDYLLGMAIWSLTQERVEKLQRQIGDKEDEITVLSSKSVQMLWKEDLEALREEWITQLEEEAAREKKVKSKGRRASAKLGIGGKPGKKRKANDSDSGEEFAPKKPKTTKSKALTGLLAMSNGVKAAPTVNGVEQKPVARPPAERQGTLDAAFSAPTSEMEIDSKPSAAATEKAAPTKKPGRPKKPDAGEQVAQVAPKPRGRAKKTVDSEDSDEDVFAAVAKEAASKPATAPLRTGRAVASKPKKYTLDSDEEMSSDDGGNDMLDDVSTMVKGIGNNKNDGPTRLFHPSNGSRPSSSYGLKQKTSRKNLADSDVSADESNWAALAQNSPQKATHRTMISDDEDDTMDIDAPKPAPKPAAKPAAKPASKAKDSAALKPKKAPAAPAAAPVPKPLSPAAKAYAAKKASAAQAKPGASKLGKKPAKLSESEEEEEEEDDADQLANEILSDEDDDSPVKPTARPSRRAAASAPKSKYVVDDDDHEEDEEDETADFDDDESD